jgi:hypothetical protein
VLQMADERDDEGHRPAEEREKQATRTEPMVY